MYPPISGSGAFIEGGLTEANFSLYSPGESRVTGGEGCPVGPVARGRERV